MLRLVAGPKSEPVACRKRLKLVQWLWRKQQEQYMHVKPACELLKWHLAHKVFCKLSLLLPKEVKQRLLRWNVSCLK